MKIVNVKTPDLNIPLFEAEPGQFWCILGRNRSGIDTFFSLLSPGQAKIPDPGICLPEDMGIFSFAGQQAVFEQELKNDDTDFMDRLDPGTLARSFIHDPDQHADLIRAFAMDQVLDQGYRQLSTGQTRKLLLLSRISSGSRWLLIQSPFDGLDKAGCSQLDLALDHCRVCGMGILVFVYDPGDIPLGATHIAVIENGTMTRSGPRQEIVSRLFDLQEQANFSAHVTDLKPAETAFFQAVASGEAPHSKELVRLEDGHAGYSGRPVFSHLNLCMAPGDHTLVSGPNGCGKSTLLQVISGDHPACYRNRLWLFGTRRGTGESIWELKKRMGIVSTELHRSYRVPGSVLDCVLSGLYDSIGLYQRPGFEDQKKALAWLGRISLSDKAESSFRTLSYADQRLALIARALIKLPDLLVLDEPTHGLDRANRDAVLDFLSQVAAEKLSTILYVSHREDEFRDFFVSHIRMEMSRPQGPSAFASHMANDGQFV
ncbi:ATP-binding cassette domain-containing protein [Desulfobacter vibrioformis]|uniref:ATP-binding cassette domain-containing protein n=1 Tax=Desulfobacter vibrioformis TaxID=34031 RepID=UPI000A0167CC|nr:ATP-binding cassette domain-containing protein [Desulfobacter vibrioformis]